MSTEQIIGYVGLVFIATSFFFADIKKLRLLNLIGALTMVVYGFMIDQLPVALLNIIIAVVNLYYLYKLSNVKTRFDLAKVNYKKGGGLDKFYQAHEEDILKFFPDFTFDDIELCSIDLMLRDFKLVGAFVYIKRGQKVEVIMDYVEPSARDMENSRYLYMVKKSEFKADGINEIISKTTIPAHMTYLQNLGFSELDKDVYSLKLKLD